MKRIEHLTEREREEGALAKVERWATYIQYEYKNIWPLFPGTPAKERSAAVLRGYVQRLIKLWNTVGSRSTGYMRANGLVLPH